MQDEIDELVGISPLVVVPGDQLHEVVVERDAGVGIENAGARIAEEIGGNHMILGVTHDALEGGFRSQFHGGLDLFVLGGFRQAAGQIHHANVGSGNPASPVRQLAVVLWEYLAAGLGGAGGGGNDVLGSAAAAAPVLGGRAVHGFLGGRGGMDRGHETFQDAPIVVHDLGKRRQTIGRAAGIGHDVLGRVVLLVVHAHHEHGSVGGRGGNDHLLGAGGEMRLGFFHRGEKARGFDYEIGAYGVPFEIGRILFGGDADGLAVHDEFAVLGFGRAFELAVGGIVLAHVGYVVHVDEFVDPDDFHIVALDGGPERQTTNPAES